MNTNQTNPITAEEFRDVVYFSQATTKQLLDCIAKMDDEDAQNLQDALTTVKEWCGVDMRTDFVLSALRSHIKTKAYYNKEADQ